MVMSVQYRNWPTPPVMSLTPWLKFNDSKFIYRYRWDPWCALIGQKPVFYQSIKHRKSMFYCLLPHYLEMAKNICFEEICNGVLCKAAEIFEGMA